MYIATVERKKLTEFLRTRTGFQSYPNACSGMEKLGYDHPYHSKMGYVLSSSSSSSYLLQKIIISCFNLSAYLRPARAVLIQRQGRSKRKKIIPRNSFQSLSQCQPLMIPFLWALSVTGGFDCSQTMGKGRRPTSIRSLSLKENTSPTFITWALDPSSALQACIGNRIESLSTIPRMSPWGKESRKRTTTTLTRRIRIRRRRRRSLGFQVLIVYGGRRKGKKADSMANNNKNKNQQPRRKLSKLSVYLYIPNIVGYIRVLMNCYAFAICFSNKRLFCLLYFISFVCDGIDGWCARKFNQVSTFGAVLDMVTDRISTACLLVILSQVYRPGLVFVSLLALDIASHWLQMYSTFLLGKANHKDVKDSSNWLFKAYYGNRMFMAYCCVACEVLYITLYLLAEKQTETLMDVLAASVKETSVISFLVGLSLFGWTIKQIVNVIQLKTAADVCVLYDIDKKERP